MKITNFLILSMVSFSAFLIGQNEIDVSITVAEVNEIEGSISISYNSLEDIHGFQFTLDGLTSFSILLLSNISFLTLLFEASIILFNIV